jgi:hypothetical protein
VKVTLTGIKHSLDFWSIDVLIDNPGGGPVFESFQHWLHNNRITLEHKESKVQWLPNVTEEEELTPVSASRAHLRYYFRAKNGGALRKGSVRDWRVIYDTPGRIVEVQVPFSLKDIPLP